MIAFLPEPEAAEARIEENLCELDRATKKVRLAGGDDDGNNLFFAPNQRASGASNTDPDFADNLRATLEDGILRGRCWVHPCTHPSLP